jgi:peptide/nickel transport system substrate-binding protein
MKTQLLEFKQGTLEESYRVPSEFFSDIVDIASGKAKGDYADFQLLSVPALATQYYGMMTQSDVFSDKRIRQAFCYAIDRERIINFVLKGQAAAPAHYGLVPPVMPGYPAKNINGYTYDVEKARALLAEAGYPNGQNFPPVTLQVNAGGGRNIQVAEAIQGMLTESIGVNVELKQVEFARHLDEIDAGRAAFYRLGWVADYPSPENFLNLLYGGLVPDSLSDPSPINSVRYKNPIFDSLFQTALTTVDREKRMELYAEAEQVAVADAPMMFIFYDQDYRFLQPYVEGYVNNAMDRRNYKFVWFNAAKM